MSNPEKVNILVVDDLPEKLLVLHSILEELGENVVAVRSGEAALGQVLKQEFAVILLDVNMPGGINGFETAQMIRARKRSAHTPIIFITAFADEMHTAQGYLLGAVDYILSPVVPEVLRAKVRVFVELFRMTQLARRQADERVALAREQALRAAAEEATRRSAFLADASRTLTRSLDPAATLRALACSAVPFLADLAAVVPVDEQGWPGPGELACLEGEEVNAHTVDSLESLPASLGELVGQAFESGWSGAANGSGPAGLTLLLRARGRTLGVLALARSSANPYMPHELALAEDLAGRAAIALDNARLHQNIQEGDRRKNDFLAMLAHELRNPLAPIRNSAEVLRRIPVEHPYLTMARDMIDRQVTHMARLVDDLLDVSRLSRGKILLRKESLDLTRLVVAVAEDYRERLRSAGLHFVVRLPERPLYVNGDPTRLAQAVGNVLHNASKFTDPGGEVLLELLEAPVGSATVRVRDTGVGIEPGMLLQIFDAFSQADRSLDRSRGGLGLGLTLVKGLVELHGGRVSATSEGIARGTEVLLELPLSAPPAVPDPTASQPEVATRRRILVIEDNPDTAESLEVLLRLSGHEVRIALSGPAGLETFRVFRPEVVLCDLGLPGGMDGHTVARAIRREPSGPSVRLIAATGYGRPEDQSRSREAGFDFHLTKPIVLNDLLPLIANAPNPNRTSELVCSNDPG